LNGVGNKRNATRVLNYGIAEISVRYPGNRVLKKSGGSSTMPGQREIKKQVHRNGSGRQTMSTCRRGRQISPPALFLCGVAIVGLFSPTQARAQADQPNATASPGLEEIVVTARRREEKLQTVPLAITAFTQQDIEKQHIQQVSDLSRQVPSFTFRINESDANGLVAFGTSLRGLPGTEIYFADVPLSSSSGAPGSGTPHGFSPGFYYDLDNLEVTNGPQGTLFGKNSIGGLISISPKHPTTDFEGYAKATFGNYDDREFEGAVNIPIVEDKVLLRVAGLSQQRDGYTIDNQTGKDLDNRNFYSWRIGLTLRPTDDFENYFLYDGYWQDANGSSAILRYADTGHVFATIPLPGIGNVPLTLGNGVALADLENPATAATTYFALLKTFLAGGKPSLAFAPTIGSLVAQQQALGARTQIGHSGDELGKDYFYGFTDAATWEVNDNLTIKNIAAARVFKQRIPGDFVGIGLPIEDTGVSGPGTWEYNYGQYTEELQLQGKALNDKLTWVAGGYLEYDAPLSRPFQGNNALGSLTWEGIGNSARSQAAFVHGVYDLSDYVEGLRFTAGYRYTWDYATAEQTDTLNTIAITRNPAGQPTNCQNTFDVDRNCFTSLSSHYSSFGWNVGLDDQLTPEILVYVRAGNAYRPGGINVNVPLNLTRYQPEHVTDVEIGEKADFTLWGVKARVNADVYHTDYKQIQETVPITVTLPSGLPFYDQATTNAATATIEGTELQADILPTDDITISPHFSYVYGHYNTFPPGIADSPDPSFLNPKIQYGVTASYHVPLDASFGDLAVSATYSWTAHTPVSVSYEIAPYIPSYDLLDLRVDWTNAFEQPVDVGFFMTNALDKTYQSGGVALGGQLGTQAFTYGEPRMFGFSVKYRFGERSEPEAAPAAYVPPPVAAPAPSVPHSYLVFFDFNKSDLTPQALSIVNQAAANAGPAKVTQLTVTGHTDTVGSDAYNMRLSRRRAESVAAQLEKDGIASSEIEIVAKGKRDLLVPTADGVKEPQNRRVQIVYSGGPMS
jgi:iron complex outermembrane receptor protein